MRLHKTNKIKVIALTLSITAISSFTAAALSNDSIRDSIKSVFITEEQSKINLEEGKNVVKQTEKLSAKEKSAIKEKLAKSSAVTAMNGKNVNNEEEKLTSDKKEELKLLRKKASKYCGVYERKEKIIKGALPSNTGRIKLEEVKQIISKNANFIDILKSMNSVHGAPDLIGGSGVTLNEYWLDETGTERIIVIVEQKDIIYSKMTQDEKVEKSEHLFKGNGEN